MERGGEEIGHQTRHARSGEKVYEWRLIVIAADFDGGGISEGGGGEKALFSKSRSCLLLRKTNVDSVECETEKERKERIELYLSLSHRTRRLRLMEKGVGSGGVRTYGARRGKRKASFRKKKGEMRTGIFLFVSVGRAPNPLNTGDTALLGVGWG